MLSKQKKDEYSIIGLQFLFIVLCGVVIYSFLHFTVVFNLIIGLVIASILFWWYWSIKHTYNRMIEDIDEAPEWVKKLIKKPINKVDK